MKKILATLFTMALALGSLFAQDGVKIITADEFNELVYNTSGNDDAKFKGRRPCVVDFYADWCAPCRAMSPILEELAEEYKGKVDIYKVNVDENKALSQKYQIRSIPLMMLCPMEGDATTIKGAVSKSVLEKAIKDNLLK